MDLHEYLRLLRRRWRLLAACVLVAGVAAFVTTPDEPANDSVTYSATHQLIRDTTSVVPQPLASVTLFVKTGEVPARVAERIDYGGNPAVLAAGVVVEANEQVGTIDITVTGRSRAQAVDRANVFAEETLGYIAERAAEDQEDRLTQINEDVSKLQTEIDALDDEIAAAEAAGRSTTLLEAERDSKLRLYGAAVDQQASVLDEPPPSAGYVTLQPALIELTSVEGGGFSAPTSRAARTAIAIAVGLFLGLAAVLVIERLDTRLHEVVDVADAFALPVVAEVPLVARKKRERVLADRNPMSALAESYRTLRSSLLLSPITRLGLNPESGVTEEEPRVILVTSPGPGDGKTTTAANLAITMAESGRTVLVLGCDFRRPEIHHYFDRPVAPGIADVLTAGRAEALADVVISTDVPGVFLAPSGAHLRSLGDVAAAGRDMVAEARKLADMVVIDTPPALATNDASELIPACDAVVVVARIDKTTTDGARRVRFLLDRLRAPVAGVVAVGVSERSGSYSHYASYYTTDGKSGQRRRRAAAADEFAEGGPQPTAAEVPELSTPSDVPASSGGTSSGHPSADADGSSHLTFPASTSDPHPDPRP